MGIDYGPKEGLGPTMVARWSEQQAESQRQIRETLELVNAGWSYRAVAERHGCTPKTVSSRYRKALKRYLPAQEVAHARKALLDRLDTLVRTDLELMGKAVRAGNIDGYVKLHAALLAAEDRRIDVMGLQAPKTLVVQQPEVVATPQETELQGLLAQARADNEAKMAQMKEQAA